MLFIMNTNKEPIQFTEKCPDAAGTPSADLRRRLAARGGRLTPQRIAIYEAVVGRTTHPSAGMVYAEVRRRFPGLSPATVYATLDLFAQLGLVHEIGGPVRRYDGRGGPHMNLICERCGTVVDVPETRLGDLERAAAARAGFEVRSARFELHGLCRTCRRRPARRGR